MQLSSTFAQRPGPRISPGDRVPRPEPQHLEIPDDADVTIIVEAGFGRNNTGFGWPDAVISVRFSEAHLVLILEAKAGLYLDEAEDFTATKSAGFNSTINGQFSLRYRLAEALREYRRGMVRLLEHEDMTRAYGEIIQRRLAKTGNLRGIVEPHLLDAEYLFIALTDDENNPWPIAAREGRTSLPFLPHPLPSGVPSQIWTDASNRWDQHSKEFGWMGFRTIESMVVREISSGLPSPSSWQSVAGQPVRSSPASRSGQRIGTMLRARCNAPAARPTAFNPPGRS